MEHPVTRGESLTYNFQLHGLLGMQVGQVYGADVRPFVVHLDVVQLKGDIVALGIQEQLHTLLGDRDAAGNPIVGQHHPAFPAVLMAPLHGERSCGCREAAVQKQVLAQAGLQEGCPREDGEDSCQVGEKDLCLLDHGTGSPTFTS